MRHVVNLLKKGDCHEKENFCFVFSVTLILASSNVFAAQCVDNYKNCIITGYNNSSSWAEDRLVDIECMARFVGCVRGTL